MDPDCKYHVNNLQIICSKQPANISANVSLQLYLCPFRKTRLCSNFFFFVQLGISLLEHTAWANFPRLWWTRTFRSGNKFGTNNDASTSSSSPPPRPGGGGGIGGGWGWIRDDYLVPFILIHPLKKEVTDQPTDGPTNRQTDGQSLLWRCVVASKNKLLS